MEKSSQLESKRFVKCLILPCGYVLLKRVRALSFTFLIWYHIWTQILDRNVISHNNFIGHIWSHMGLSRECVEGYYSAENAWD